MAGARVGIAIFAKAPLPGFAKTRLVPALGAGGAAALQEKLVRRAVAAAVAANLGPVTLWCAPDAGHALFGELARDNPVSLAVQTGDDLGARMFAAFAAAPGPLILIGTDCPSIDTRRLCAAAETLAGTDGATARVDLLLDPAEDGGYGLIAGRALPRDLFEGMAWSTASVAAETLRRAVRLGLRTMEGPLIRDLDTPEDLAHWLRRIPELVSGIPIESACGLMPTGE